VTRIDIGNDETFELRSVRPVAQTDPAVVGVSITVKNVGDDVAVHKIGENSSGNCGIRDYDF
jgi:hypothetical protein